MEKVVVALWADANESRESFGNRLLQSLPEALKRVGAQKIRLNIRDAFVKAVDSPKPTAVSEQTGTWQKWQSPQQAAIVQFWLPSANILFRKPIDAVLAKHSARFEAWLVCESTIIPNVDHAPTAGQRTWGWSQCTFFCFRGDITREAAVSHWVGHHTPVAIETQSNFEYIQNIVVRPLTDTAPRYDAFVEECFPPAALVDPAVLLDALGNQEKFDKNNTRMNESCDAFIGPGRIDCIPTSQFSFFT